MSVLGKKWIIKRTSGGLDGILKERTDYLSQDDVTFHDPFLFRDMQKVVDRITKAIVNDERIIVFGDYDVDGITAATILVRTLQKLGAKVSYRIPHREKDGYGLSMPYIEEFAEKNVSLVITVDCGISCKNEIEAANEANIDVIVTDHHQIPQELPDALGIIHPKIDDSYPFHELTGAGVALKLAQALLPEHADTLTDLAAMGTIADIGPVIGENRAIISNGLEQLQNTKWVGLAKILENSQKDEKKYNTETVGYVVAPRINASGRIGSGYTAMKLLLHDESNQEVTNLALQLEQLNERRKEMTMQSMLEATNHFMAFKPTPSILVASHPDWHVGILGLIAGKLAEKLHRPAIIMQERGDHLVASARSPEYFNIVEALTHCGDHLMTYGGHAQAAGFSIAKKSLPAFKKAIIQYGDSKLRNTDLRPTLDIDQSISLEEVTLESLNKLEQIRPFGVGNQNPIFILQGIEPQYIKSVGKGQNHLSFSLKKNDEYIKAIGFGLGNHVDDLRRSRLVDIVFQLDENIWKGKKSVQAKILDFRPHTR